MYSNPYQKFYDPNLASYLNSLIKDLESKIGAPVELFFSLNEEALGFLNNNSSDIEIPMPPPCVGSVFFEPSNKIKMEPFLNRSWIQAPKQVSGKLNFVFRRTDYKEVLNERVKEKLREENTSSPEKENNWFPILIQLTEAPSDAIVLRVCNAPEEIPLGKAFRVIATNYTTDKKLSVVD